jgi:hypothetical protein
MTRQSDRRIPRWPVVSPLAALLLAAACGYVLCPPRSHAQSKPAEARTILPAVPLSDAQLLDIAGKAEQAARRSPVPHRSIASWKPAAVAKPGMEPPMAPTERAGLAGNASPLALPIFHAPANKLAAFKPQPAPSLTGVLLPFSLKPDEIAVIDGRVVHLQRPPSAERGK